MIDNGDGDNDDGDGGDDDGGGHGTCNTASAVLHNHWRHSPRKGSCEAAWAACPRPVAPAPGTPETYGAGGAVPELWPMPNLQSG